MLFIDTTQNLAESWNVVVTGLGSILFSPAHDGKVWSGEDQSYISQVRQRLQEYPALGSKMVFAGIVAENRYIEISGRCKIYLA